MGTSFQTAKRLILKPKRIFFAIVLIAVILLSQNTNALGTTPMLTCTLAGGQTIADVTALIPTTERNMIQAGYQAFMFIQSSAAPNAQNYTTPRLVISTELTSGNFTRISQPSTYPQIDVYGKYKMLTFSDAGGTSAQVGAYSSMTGETGSTATWNTAVSQTTNNGRHCMVFANTSITFDGTYGGSTSGWSYPVIDVVTDFCSNIDGDQNTVPDGYYANGGECFLITYDNNITISGGGIKGAFNYGTTPAYSAVTGGTNEWCKPGKNWSQGYDWKEVVNATSDSYTNASTLKDRVNNGDYVMVVSIRGDSGYSGFIVIAGYGSASLVWTPSGDSTYIDGATHLDPSGQMTYGLYTPSCSIFNTADPPPVVTPTITNTSTNLRIDSRFTTNRQVGNLSGVDAIPTHLEVSFMIGVTANYPVGYGGATIGDRPTEVSDVIYADFDLYTTGTTIRATYRGSPYDDTKCVVLQWQIASATSPLEVMSYYTKLGEDFNHVLPEPDTYRLNVTWTWRITQMSTVGLNDADASYCQSKNPEIVHLYQSGKLPLNTGKIFPVNLLDSEFFGYTEWRVCELDTEQGIGFNNPTMLCEYDVTWDLEDCSQYSFITELDERAPCEIENFFRRLWSFFIRLFVPNPASLTTKIEAVSQSATVGGNVGQIPVQLFTSVYNASVTATPDCDFIANGATFDFCAVEDINSDIFNLIKFVVNFTIITAFAYSVWRFITSVFGSNS